MRGLVSKASMFLRKNGSTILTYAGGIGAVATSIMAVKATPKAIQLMNKAKEEKGEPLTKFEIVKVATPVYISSVVVGASTLVCIFGANVLNKRTQASLVSAYALANESFKEYRNKIDELYGEEVNNEITKEIAKDRYSETDISVHDDEQLFYDAFSDQYFTSTMFKVQQAEYYINRDLTMRDYAYLNEFYEYLDIDEIEGGWKLGWSTGSCLAAYWQPWLDFGHSKVTMDDGRECTIIRMFQEPFADFEDYA